MKFNLFRRPEAVAAPEPTGVTGATGATTATGATSAPTQAYVSTSVPDLDPGSNITEISKNDMFEEIKSKFLNEIDKIPCKL